MNIQNDIGKVLGYIEREYSVVVKSYFVPIGKNRTHTHLTMDLKEYKFEVDHYRHTYCFTEKLSHIRKNWKAGQEVI